MKNPINSEVFDSRDLIKYYDELSSELIDHYNDYMKEKHDQNQLELGEEDERNEYEEIDDLDEIESNSEFVNYADDLSDMSIKEFFDLKSFVEELEDSPDFKHGESIIHSSYFTEYCEELVKDVGYLPKELPWFISDNIDWDGVAADLKADYMKVEYDGFYYYIRS
jgi:hypothetical protein